MLMYWLLLLGAQIWPPSPSLWEYSVCNLQVYGNIVYVVVVVVLLVVMLVFEFMLALISASINASLSIRSNGSSIGNSSCSNTLAMVVLSC
jgi:hypothetical protein